MRRLKQIFLGSVFVLLAALGFSAETNGFRRQMIELPAKDMEARFLALDNSKREALLAIDPVNHEILIYRQRESGFANAPDQVIELPKQTAWVAPYRAGTNAVVELLASTANGVVSFPQSGGVFSSTPRPLISAEQVFTNHEPPVLISLPTNNSIPIITATQAWSYQRNSANEWIAGPPTPLERTNDTMSGHRNEWTLGQNSAWNLTIYQPRFSAPEKHEDDKPENATIGKILQEMRTQSSLWNMPHTERLDLNRDGKPDLILWQAVGNLDTKTDIYIFLRGADDQLTERPTQTLHCRGSPIPLGSTRRETPFGDLDGDGKYELVLMEPVVVMASVGGMVDMALSRGVDLALTVRTFSHGEFARAAVASLPLKVMLSWYGTGHWPFFICGDFNGDGSPDLLVQRSAAQWEIFLSTKDIRWFDARPAMILDQPSQGYFGRNYFEISDLNGDGRSDIVLRDPDDPRIFIFLTQPAHNQNHP